MVVINNGKAETFVSFWMNAAEEFEALAKFFAKEAKECRERAARRVAAMAFKEEKK